MEMNSFVFIATSRKSHLTMQKLNSISYEMILDFLTAIVKVFGIVSVLQLPMENFRRVCTSSLPVIIFILFLFTVGETQAIIPSMIIVIIYICLELPNFIHNTHLRKKKHSFVDYSVA